MVQDPFHCATHGVASWPVSDSRLPAICFSKGWARPRARPIDVGSPAALRASLDVPRPAVFVIGHVWTQRLSHFVDVVAVDDRTNFYRWNRVLGFLADARARNPTVEAVIRELDRDRVDNFDTTLNAILHAADEDAPDAAVIVSVHGDRLLDLAQIHRLKIGPVLREEDIGVEVESAGPIPAQIERAFAGHAPIARTTRALAMNAATSLRAAGSVVLLGGPAGSGKRVLARALIDEAIPKRAPRPVEEVHCGAFLDDREAASALFGSGSGPTVTLGAWERALGGALVLIEVTDLSLRLQRQVATALREGHFRRPGLSDPSVRLDAVDQPRVIATTRKFPGELLDPAVVDETLAHTLRAHAIRVPSVLERFEDFEEIVGTLWAGLEDEPLPPLEPEIPTELMRYDWPGNVRELKSFLTMLARRSGGRPTVDRVRRSLDEIQTASGWGLALPRFPAPSECIRVLGEAAAALRDLELPLRAFASEHQGGEGVGSQNRGKDLAAALPLVEQPIERLRALLRQPFAFADEGTLNTVHEIDRLVSMLAGASQRVVLELWAEAHGAALLREAVRKVGETLTWLRSLG